MRLLKQAHAVYRTQYHLVWVTRYRRKILKDNIKTSLRDELHEITQYHPDWQPVEIGIASDQGLPPGVCSLTDYHST